MNNSKQKLFLPPIFRFIMEITAWLWFLVLAFTVDVFYIFGFIGSALLLSIFNFPGDKKIEGPVNIPGWLRILNEWFSGGLLGLFGAWLLFGDTGVIFQLLIFGSVIILDRERYYWMLGLKDTVPDYVSVLREK